MFLLGEVFRIILGSVHFFGHSWVPKILHHLALAASCELKYGAHCYRKYLFFWKKIIWVTKSNLISDSPFKWLLHEHVLNKPFKYLHGRFNIALGDFIKTPHCTFCWINFCQIFFVCLSDCMFLDNLHCNWFKTSSKFLTQRFYYFIPA